MLCRVIRASVTRVTTSVISVQVILAQCHNPYNVHARIEFEGWKDGMVSRANDKENRWTWLLWYNTRRSHIKAKGDLILLIRIP